MMTFEEAEAMLTPKRKSELAHYMLDNQALAPIKMTEEEHVFCFGLSNLCEYEQRDEAEKYLR